MFEKTESDSATMPRRKRPVKNLVITPRSSSIDTRPSPSSSPHLRSSSTTDLLLSPSSYEELSPGRERHDIMDYPHIRASCIRVHDIKNQSHIIKIKQGDQFDVQALRARIYQKFNVSEGHELFIIHPSDDKSLKKLHEDELAAIIADHENKNRGNIILRKVVSSPNTQDNIGTKPQISPIPADSQRILRLQKFFGSTTPGVKSPVESVGRHGIKSPVESLGRNHGLKSPLGRESPVRSLGRDFIAAPQFHNNLMNSSKTHSSKTHASRPPRQHRPERKSDRKSKSIKFFGERPPSELIANQLQTFFPGLDDDKRGSMISDVVKGKISDKKRSNIPSLYGSVADKRRTILHSESASTIVSNYTQNNYTQSTRNFDIPEEETGSLENKVTRWKKGMMIGQGAFGKVYHALDLDTGEMMAVKQVPFANTSINKKQIDALKSEINLLKNLDYANVVKYLGFEITDSEINVFLEYVSGGSISSVLALTGAFPQIYCQNFAAQILCGLDYLHKRNVIHRDIKGANILIDQYGIAKITDFGISKIHDKKVYDRQTRMSMQGSIYWMAPEVAKGTMGYSGKVDIWSLGCLVLEMLTGEHPWQGIGGSVIFHLGNGRAPPLEEHGLSQISQQFLKLCFSIDPENRPTAFELLHHDYTDVGVNNFEVDFPTWYLESKNNRDSSEDEEDEDYDEEDSGMERMTLTEGNHGYLQPSY